MNVYKRFLNILRHRGEDLLLFEILMRGINVIVGTVAAIVLSTVAQIKTGYTPINGDLFGFVDGTYLVLLSLCTLILLFTSITEIVGLVHISHSYTRAERPSQLATLRYSAKKALGLFHAYGLTSVLIIFFAFILFPVFQIGPSVFRNFALPDFVTGELLKSGALHTLYQCALVVFAFIFYRSVFTFHIFATRRISLFGSLRASWLITFKRKSLRHFLTFGVLWPALISLLLIAGTAVSLLVFVSLLNGLVGLFFSVLPASVYILFYSSWVFISTALLSILVAPSVVTALTAYLEVRNPIALGIETEAEHEHALALLKNRHVVWLFAQKKRILTFGVIVFVLFIFSVNIFMNVFIPPSSGKSPEVISHRGQYASASLSKAEENTTSAFQGAITIGSADGIETDLQMLKDGTIVFFHDESLQSFGRGDKLKELTLAELQESGINLTTLDGFFDNRNFDCKKTWLFEIKNYGTKNDSIEIAHQLREKLISHNMLTCSYVGSFDLPLLLDVKSLYSDIKTNLYIYSLPNSKTDDADILSMDAISVEEGLRASDVIRRFIDEQKPVYMWTINDLQKINHLQRLGITGIITDNPEAVREYLDKNPENNKIQVRIVRIFGKTFIVNLGDIWQFKFRYSL